MMAIAGARRSFQLGQLRADRIGDGDLGIRGARVKRISSKRASTICGISQTTAIEPWTIVLLAAVKAWC